ncbi:MAG: hypothetical protein CXT66_00995 [Methanobacteriota archaeon]|nr:MAG: hypothetical protein CXT66_00995 [Euryarchaeota archaeon]
MISFLHLIGAAIWIGSMIFFVTILVPYSKKKYSREEYLIFLNDVGLRFRWLGWACLLTVSITGIFLSDIIVGWDSFTNAGGHSNPPASTIAWKMIGGALLFISAALHDFYFGPRAIKCLTEKGDCDESRKLRRRASTFARVNLILSLTIFLLGVSVIRGGII